MPAMIKDRKPLGIMELTTGPKEIYPTNDFFVNYMFEKPKYWPILRHIINILFERYMVDVPTTTITLITTNLKVKTQSKYFTNMQGEQKTQDLQIEDVPQHVFAEIQNRALSKFPLETRALEYLGLSLASNSGKNITQLWILAQDADELLKGKTFTNYTLTDEQTGERYPIATNLMAVSLQRLAKTTGEAADLAQFLLGKVITPSTPRLCTIVEGFNSNMVELKADKEAKTTMSLMDKSKYEGWEEGREAGLEAGIEAGSEASKTAIALKMHQNGFTIEQISHLVDLPLETLQTLFHKVSNS